MTDPSVESDELLSLAFSLHASPGAYALLLGAGVSAPSGIPTAWGVLEDLVSQVANLLRASPEDPMRWYEEKFGEPPTYEGLLERVAPTQAERQRVLRSYFEQTSDEAAAGTKTPTSAHRSIARLVRSNAVRVIVTLNFDHLIERALRDEGIEPTIIASTADAAGAAPLHTLECCVVHLHGDYLNPSSMLNTVTELEAYPAEKSKLLTTILENYGLIIAGWSSRYDPALRAALAAHYPNRFTMTWFEPGPVPEEAAALRTLKKGALSATNADTAFAWLADGVDALAARRSRPPLTVPLSVEIAKRELSGQTVAINLHDLLHREFTTLHELPEFHLADHHADGDYETLLSRVEEATRVTGALVATLAYWGNDSTDGWWIDEIPRFATRSPGSGLVKLLTLRVVSGSVLFYAAGVAAAAAGRFDLLARLFTQRHVDPYRNDYDSIARHLDSQSTYESAERMTTRLFELVSPLLLDSLALGPQVLDDAWQLFELLRLAWATQHEPRFAESRTAYAETDRTYMEADAAFSRAEKGDGGDLDAARALRASAYEDRDREMGKLLWLVPARRPHILTVDLRMDERYKSVVAERLISDLNAEGTRHPVMVGGLSNDLYGLVLALKAVSRRLGTIGSELSWARVQERVGSIPSQIWLDSALTPKERAHRA